MSASARSSPGGMSAPYRADACGEIPYLDVVMYNTERMERIGYLDRFSGYFRQLGLDAAECHALKTASAAERGALLERAGERSGWLNDPAAHLRAAGCSLLVVPGEDVPSSMGVRPLEPEQLLERFAALDADVRLYVGVDPHAPRSLQQAAALRSHPRFAGITVMPFLSGIALDQAAHDHILRSAHEWRIPVWVHCSAHFRADVAYDIEHPRTLDTVLRRYPGLRLIAGHAGWPWTDEACIIALRHPSMALEFSTFPPSLIPQPGWSLTPLLANAAALRGRIFFGSGATSSPKRYAQLFRQLDDLGLGDDHTGWSGQALRAWLDGDK